MLYDTIYHLITSRLEAAPLHPLHLASGIPLRTLYKRLEHPHTTTLPELVALIQAGVFCPQHITLALKTSAHPPAAAKFSSPLQRTRILRPPKDH